MRRAPPGTDIASKRVDATVSELNGGANRISSLPGTQTQNPNWSRPRRRCPASRVEPGAVESEHAGVMKTANVRAVLTTRAGQFGRSRMAILRKREACFSEHATPKTSEP